MCERIVSNPRHSVAVLGNLPIGISDVGRHQTSQIAGGFISGVYDVIHDYISEEFGVDLTSYWGDIPSMSM